MVLAAPGAIPFTVIRSCTENLPRGALFLTTTSSPAPSPKRLPKNAKLIEFSYHFTGAPLVTEPGAALRKVADAVPGRVMMEKEENRTISAKYDDVGGL